MLYSNSPDIHGNYLSYTVTAGDTPTYTYPFYQPPSYPYYQPYYYTCGTCGMLVQSGTTHVCQPSYSPYDSTAPAIPFDPQKEQLRQELNRIATALEKLVDRGHNVHEEVCGHNDGGSTSDTVADRRSREGTTEACQDPIDPDLFMRGTGLARIIESV